MTWEIELLGKARRSTQQRFKIFLETLNFFSEEFQSNFDPNSDEEQYLAYKQGFAKELLEAIGDHLSISDLEQIVEVFKDELFEREAERSRDIRRMDDKGVNKHPLPIPRLTAKGNSAMKWYCHSAEYCTHDGSDAFFCSGHGDTPEEAYRDWLEVYLEDRYYEEKHFK